MFHENVCIHSKRIMQDASLRSRCHFTRYYRLRLRTKEPKSVLSILSFKCLLPSQKVWAILCLLKKACFSTLQVWLHKSLQSSLDVIKLSSFLIVIDQSHSHFLSTFTYDAVSNVISFSINLLESPNLQ